MSKAKETRKKIAVVGEQALPATAWPEDFAPPRTAMLMAVCCAVLGGMMFVAALFGALGPVKIALASVLGMYNPAMVSDSSFDLAIIVWGLGAILLGGVVHPSIGIAVLVVFRPWIDGYTFPTDNLYFVAGVFVLTAFWAVRVTLRGGRIRGLGFAAPLALWLLVVVAGLHSSWEFMATSRQALLWFSYLMLFVLTVNSATSRLSVGILVGGLGVSMGLEALFAILHYEFLLPFLREIVKKPGVLQQFFGTDTITPELARRFSINRAFGSVLFPNSLAAYLLLGAPVISAGAWLAWRRLRETVADILPASPRAASFAALGVWFVALFLTMFICHFPAVYRDESAGTPWYCQIHAIFAFAALVALAPAAWVYFLSLRRGLAQCGRALTAWGLTLALVLVLWAFIITYSRGGWLALAAACVWAGLLLTGRTAIQRQLRRLLPALVAVVLVAGMAWGWSRVLEAEAAWAQQAKPGAAAPATATEGPRSTNVTQEGTAVSAKDLMDPASFRIRLTYWRVALSMARHNLLSGVGLGNFSVAYAHYQYLGAGDVREAHSGYLQAFCETGLPGGLLFALFWAALVAGGALNVLRAPDSRTRLWLLALHTGLLAFCLHAAIDINFSHPSLVMTAMVVAGLGLGWRGQETPDPAANPVPGKLAHRVLAGAMLVVLAFAGGLVARIWLQEVTLSRLAFANTSNDQEIFRRFHTARFFVEDVYKYFRAVETGKPPRKAPQLPFREALNLNPDPERWAKSCDFFVTDKENPNGYRRLKPGEPIPLDSVIMLRKPRLAWITAINGLSGWLVELEGIDSRFPHNPELATHITRLYELLAKNAFNLEFADYRTLWTTGYYDWARTALARSPHSAEMHELYANVMAYRALWDSPYDPIPVMESCLAHAQTAAEYSPLTPAYRYFLNWALEKMAGLQQQAGDPAKAGEFTRRAEQAKQEAKELQTRRWQLGIDY